MVKVKAEIIAVGTELLLGQIANTNAQWISQQLATKGIGVYYHQVVGDNRERLLSVLAEAVKRSNLILISGGLGPTDDDLTRETVAEFVGQNLSEDEEALTQVERYFQRTNREMTVNNRKQAQLITGATLIPNKVGTAPGMIVDFQGSTIVMMPGVPSELKNMMTASVLPYLSDRFELNDVIVSKMLRFIGIGESQLETEVKSLIEQQSNPTIAPLASDGEVALRLTAKAGSVARANQLITATQAELEALVGSYIYGYDDQSLSEVVIDLLTKQSATVAAAESLTGGRFADAFVTIPGAGHVLKGSIVSYTPDAKVNVLGIDQTIIELHGMVSEQCALQMAKQAKEKFNTTYGISFTGVAGPDQLEGKEPGTVYICLYQSEDNYLLQLYHFPKNRELVRNRSVKKGLELLYQTLKKNEASSS